MIIGLMEMNSIKIYRGTNQIVGIRDREEK